MKNEVAKLIIRKHSWTIYALNMYFCDVDSKVWLIVLLYLIKRFFMCDFKLFYMHMFDYNWKASYGFEI